MKKYAVQYDDDSGPHYKAPVVICRTDSLDEAVAICEASESRRCYVVHVAFDLQRFVIEGRIVWLDAKGRERPSPETLKHAH